MSSSIRLELEAEVEAVNIDFVVTRIDVRSKAMRRGAIIKGWHGKNEVQTLQSEECQPASG